jgi:hypothetical protein
LKFQTFQKRKREFFGVLTEFPFEDISQSFESFTAKKHSKRDSFRFEREKLKNRFERVRIETNFGEW